MSVSRCSHSGADGNNETRPPLDPDALTVCITHGRFIPCRKDGEHYVTQDPYSVDRVRLYQGDETWLTWESVS